MTVVATGRYAARLYGKRRRAIDRNVPFSLPGEGGQGGHSAGQGTNAEKANDFNAGQGGQGGQGTKNTAGENAGACVNFYQSLPPCEKKDDAFSSHGPNKCPDHPDHPDQASNGAGFRRSGHTEPTLSALTTNRPWTDDRAWISEVVQAKATDERLATLFSWVIAASGWIEGMTALLPPLPHGLAALELRRMLRQSRIEPRECAEMAVPEGPGQ